jgi:hypothetical protein
MMTLTLRAEIGPDGVLRLDVPSGLPPGPVEVIIRPLPVAAESGQDWWQFLQSARARLDAAGSPTMSDEEVAAHVEDLRSGDEWADS